MPTARPEDEPRRIAQWLRLEGLPRDFLLEIHPRDEMFLGLCAPGAVRPGRERLIYLRNGQEPVDVLEHALAACGRTLGTPARVLELACGYGRVTRHLQRRVATGRLVASEIVPAAREFVTSRFGVECLVSQADPATIRWPGRFDVVFVSSLFSHLPRHRFSAWLAALRRALTDDGVLALSTHGLWMPQAPPHDGHGLAFHPESESLTLDGQEYGTTFVAPEEVERLAREAGFAEVRGLERELWKLQDLFVMSPAPLPAARRWTPAPVLDGAIDGCDFGGGALGGVPGALVMHGWVECRDPQQPIDRVTLHVDDVLDGPVALGPSRREEQPPPEPSQRVVASWLLHATVPAGIAGRRTLALVVEAGATRRTVDVRTVDLDERELVDGGG